MKHLVLAALVTGVAACTSAPRETAVAQAAGPVPAALPTTYWPLDHSVARADTVVSGRPPYRVTIVTTCLNDSAVIDRVIEDKGALVDIAHNYQSEVTVLADGQPYLHAHVTKEAFAAAPEVKAFAAGDLSTLFFSRTAYQRREQNAVVFLSRLGFPDSDVFAEIEWSLEPGNRLRFRKLLKQQEAE